MSTNEFAVENGPVQAPRRVVEAEFRMPKREDLHMPEVDLAPVRTALGEVLITGLGVGVLLARGVAAAVKAAYQAGAEAAKQPGSFSQAVVDLVRGEAKATPAATARLTVPVLPIEGYDDLSAKDVVARLEGLGAEHLAMVREYEAAHANRVTVLKDIAKRLEQA